MKKIMKLAIISSFMALGMVAANAQSNGVVVIPVNFALSGFKQTGDSTAAAVRVSNKDIFNALNGTSNGTVLVRKIPFGFPAPCDFANMGGILYFRANDGGGSDQCPGEGRREK